MEQPGILATQFRLQLRQQFPGDADQLSIDSKPHAAVPSFTDQLHDTGSSRAHANADHDARDAATGHSLANYAITWIPSALPVRPQKAWLTPSADWTPGDGMLDINQLYNFSLPMTVANTPHNNLRDMSGMDIRDVRLVQVIHGGLTCPKTAPEEQLRTPMSRPVRMCHATCGSTQTGKHEVINALALHYQPLDRRRS